MKGSGFKRPLELTIHDKGVKCASDPIHVAPADAAFKTALEVCYGFFWRQRCCELR